MTKTKHDWSRADAMSEAERHAAALSDPDAPPLTPERLATMRRTPQVRIIRRALGLSQEEFATRFHIPLGTLRDWEQGRKEPDAAARAYLMVIGRDPSAVTAALHPAMKALSPRPVTRRDVNKFIDHCVMLRAFWLHYQALFEGSDLKRELLQNTAHKFFHDLNLMLIEHLILQVCKLSDPESTKGKRNLTIQFLLNNADFSASPGDLVKAKKLGSRIEAFRESIKPARNKRISHLDLEAALAPKSLGGASLAAWRRFWRDLQAFVAILSKRYVDAKVPFYLNGVGGMSDADQLVKAIKESTYFRALLDDDALTRKASEAAFNSRFYDA